MGKEPKINPSKVIIVQPVVFNPSKKSEKTDGISESLKNKILLSEFMGFVNKYNHIPGGQYVEKKAGVHYSIQHYKSYKYEELLYDTDWNWIMEVVEKIEILGSSTIINRPLYSRFEINHNHIKLSWSKDNGYQLYLEVIPYWMDGRGKSLSIVKEYKRIDVQKETTKIEAVYIACVEFVQWLKNTLQDYEFRKICLTD